MPVYGKFAGFNNFIFQLRHLRRRRPRRRSRTKPIPVIDPDNRTFSYKPKLDFDVGIGLRIFFNRWFAAILEMRDYMLQ